MSRLTFWIVVVIVLATGFQRADAQEAWKRPPAEVVRLLEAAPLPGMSLDPLNKTLLLTEREALPPLSEVGRPMLRLAGLRIDPGRNAPHGPRTTVGLSFQDVASGVLRRIDVPADAGIGNPAWSDDGSKIAFTTTSTGGLSLWVAAVADAKARRVVYQGLNAIGGNPFTWMADGQRLLVRLIPKGLLGDAPRRPIVPPGPTVQETIGRVAPVRTYQDLLKDPHDEALFEYYSTAQLAMVSVAGGEPSLIGAPAMITQFSTSPDGKKLLVATTLKPFSFVVPASSFPDKLEVWDFRGTVLRELSRRPLRDDTPIDGVPTGPRGHRWRPTAPATVVWTEALDGGDPKSKVPHRDRLLALDLAAGGEPRELLKTEHRAQGVEWIASGGLCFVTENDRDRRWTRTWLFDAELPGAKARVVADRSQKDRYGDPGNPVSKPLPSGKSAVHVHEGSIFLSGAGATPEGDRPFLDRMNLETLAKERLWRAEGACVESVVELLDAGGSKLLLRHESPAEPPNYRIVDRATKGVTKVTDFKDPAPELRGIKKRIVTYARDDGVKLSATLYLPAGYVEGHRLPLVVWAYPEEFNDPATAGQISGSPHRFTRIDGLSHLTFLTQGYAVMDGASMPVVGPPESANDTFVAQTVSSAKAAIDYAAKLGVADPARAGVGGHSYGAFMTANLLAHSGLFRAGIARSGAYNRTLTPFGFQNERRTFWEAASTYVGMSPFAHAHKIKTPLLMTHGEADSNPGTFPIQSERLYAAIKGHGGTTRLVVLPYEDHGYRARESVLHVQAEMIEWFDKYVKSAPTSAH